MKKYLFVVLLLFFSSCNDDTLYDRVGSIICTDKADCGEGVPEFLGTPSNEEKFSQTLKNSRLQYPDSTTDVDYGEFDGVVKPYFYLDESFLTFQLDKQSNQTNMRSELRFGPDLWDVTTQQEHLLSARVRCYGSEKLPQYTFIQIHGDKEFNLPLLRLTWAKRRKGLTNHLWALIMTSRDMVDKTYEWVDLGVRKDTFFDIEVSIKSNGMLITMDGKVFVDKDLSYWYDVQNYYKAGLYLDDLESKGKTKLQFEKLDYIVR